MGYTKIRRIPVYPHYHYIGASASEFVSEKRLFIQKY